MGELEKPETDQYSDIFNMSWDKNAMVIDSIELAQTKI